MLSEDQKKEILEKARKFQTLNQKLKNLCEGGKKQSTQLRFETLL